MFCCLNGSRVEAEKVQYVGDILDSFKMKQIEQIFSLLITKMSAIHDNKSSKQAVAEMLAHMERIDIENAILILCDNEEWLEKNKIQRAKLNIAIMRLVDNDFFQSEELKQFILGNPFFGIIQSREDQCFIGVKNGKQLSVAFAMMTNCMSDISQGVYFSDSHDVFHSDLITNISTNYSGPRFCIIQNNTGLGVSQNGFYIYYYNTKTEAWVLFLKIDQKDLSSSNRMVFDSTPNILKVNFQSETISIVFENEEHKNAHFEITYRENDDGTISWVQKKYATNFN